MNTRMLRLPRIAYSALAGVARGGAEDVQALSGFLQRVLEQVAQQLHRDVLERQRRAVATTRRICSPGSRVFSGVMSSLRTESARVGARDDIAQVVRGNVVGKPRQDLEGKFRRSSGRAIGPVRPHRSADRFRAGKPAVGREAVEQDLGKLFGGMPPRVEM